MIPTEGIDEHLTRRPAADEHHHEEVRLSDSDRTDQGRPTATRSVGLSELMDLGPDEERVTPPVKIEATPEELRAHMEFHVERAIKRKIEQGELKRVNGDEK